MDIYALIGPTGTGKSHQAMTVATEYNIDTMIDDGLLIHEGRRLSGSSAKAEKNALSAVKRAIFTQAAHRDEMIAAIRRVAPDKLMILGTSRKMVDRITQALDLPRPSHIINIEDVSTQKDINTARELRKEYGMHLIPVPVVEVKEDLQGYLTRPIRYLMRLKAGQRQGEKTIVQPKFSTTGKLVITNRALTQVVSYLAHEVSGVARVNKVRVEIVKGIADIYLEFTALVPGYIPAMAEKIDQLLRDRVLILCGINIENISMLVRGIIAVERLSYTGGSPHA